MLVDRSGLWKGGPVKMLTEGKTKSERTQQRRTHHHAPHRRRAQAVLPARRLPPPQARRAGGGGAARVRPEPHPAFIALIKYEDGELGYILAPQRLAAGDRVVAGAKVDVKPGNAMPLSAMPIGTIVHNVEMKPGRGGQIGALGGLVRATRRPRRRLGGAQAQLGRDAARTRRLHGHSGRGVQPDHSNQVTGKADRTRWQGRRPTVRSIAMNPVDHPNGRTKGGKRTGHALAKEAKGFKTRKNKAADKYIVRSRQLKK